MSGPSLPSFYHGSGRPGKLRTAHGRQARIVLRRREKLRTMTKSLKKSSWTLRGRLLTRTFERTNLMQGIQLLGGLVTVIGVLMVAFPFRAGPEGRPFGPAAPWVLVGAVLTGLGAALLLARHGRILDGRVRLLTSWWGVLVPWYRQECSLQGARVVEITLETRPVQGGRGPSYVDEYYGVTLLGTGRPLRLDRFLDDPDEARFLGESVSRVLGVRYRDRTVVPVVEKTADQLDESLVQRFLRTRQEPPVPRPPDECRASYRSLPEGLEVHIPRAHLADPVRELAPGLALVLLIPAVTVLGVEAPWILGLVMGVLGAAAFVGTRGRAVLQASRLTETVLLTPRSLRVDSSVYGVQEIPLEKLEELVLRDLSPHKRYRQTQVEGFFCHGFLRARGDEIQARFGGALDGVELEYVRDLLIHRMVAWGRSGSGC